MNWPPTSSAVLTAAPAVLCALATPLILESVFSGEGDPDSVQAAFLLKESRKRRAELALILKLELSRHPTIRSHVRDIMPMCTVAWVDGVSGAAAAADSQGGETGGRKEGGLDDSMVGQADKLLHMSDQLFQLRPKDSAAAAEIHAARLLGTLLLSEELRVVTALTERATDEKYKSGEVLAEMSTKTEQGALKYESRRNGSTGYNPNGDLAIAAVRASIAEAKGKLLDTWRAAQAQVRRRTRQRYSKVAELILASRDSIPWIVADSALTVVSTAVGGLTTWFAGRTLNILVAASRGGSKESASTTQGKVARALLSMLATQAVGTLLEQYHSVMRRKGKRQFTLGLQVRIFEAILTQDLAWMDAQDDKYKLHRLIWSVPRAAASLLRLPNTVVNIATTTYTSFLLLRAMSSKLGGVVLGTLGAQWLVAKLLHWLRNRVWEGSQFVRASGKTSPFRLFNKQEFRTMRSFGREQGEIADYRRNEEAKEKYTNDGGLDLFLLRCIDWLEATNEVVPMLIQYIIGARLVIRGRLSAGDLTMAISEGERIFSSFQRAVKAAKSLNRTLPQFEVIVDLLRRTPEIGVAPPKPPHCAPAPAPGSPEDRCFGEIEFDNVSFSYPTNKKVSIFNDLTFKIEAGQCVGLMGEAGCGKSSSFALLMRFYDPLHGAIRLDGRDIKDVNPMWLRRKIGHVGQEPVLFGKSLREEVIYGLGQDPGQERLDRLAEEGQPLHFIHKKSGDGMPKFPLGWLTSCDNFSGGEKQRVALARAMVLEPSILLLDEATSALDEENQAVVMNAIEELTHPILGWAKGSKQMSAWLAESGFAKQRAALMTLSGRELVAKLEEREGHGKTGAAIACGGRIIAATVCDELASAIRRAQHTTLVIAHRLSTLQKCDAIMCFKDGKVVEFGTHEELLACEDGVYAKYVARQHGRDGTAASDVPRSASVDGKAETKADGKADAKATTPQQWPKRVVSQASAPQLRRSSSAPETARSPKAAPRLLRSWVRDGVADPMFMNIATLQERLRVIKEKLTAAERGDPEGPVAQLRVVLDQMQDEGRRISARIKNIDRRRQRDRTDAFSGPPRRRIAFPVVVDELRVGDELLSRSEHRDDHHSGVFASKVAASSPRRGGGGIPRSRAPLPRQINDRSLGLVPPALSRTQSMF